MCLQGIRRVAALPAYERGGVLKNAYPCALGRQAWRPTTGRGYGTELATYVAQAYEEKSAATSPRYGALSLGGLTTFPLPPLRMVAKPGYP